MKDNKGFTLVELITSFALASVIMIFIFNIVVILKNNYISKSIRTDLLIKQSLLSQKINEDLTNNNVKDIVTCDTEQKCYDITFADDTTKRLSISADDKVITYGDYTYELTNSSYTSKINVSVETVAIDDITLNNSILVIDIPIYNKKYSNTNFGIKVVYQYNSNIYDFGIKPPVSSEYSYTTVGKGNSWYDELNSEWNLYLKRNNSTNKMELCKKYVGGTVCIEPNKWDCDERSGGHCVNSTGYVETKKAEFEAAGATCTLGDGYLRCEDADEYETHCHVLNSNRVTCSLYEYTCDINSNGSYNCYYHWS